MKNARPQKDDQTPTPPNFWRDAMMVVLGGFLAISGSVVTTYIGDQLQARSRKTQDNEARIELMAALQAEIEANLLLMNAQFVDYHASVVAGMPLNIQPVRPAMTVYKSSSGRLGELDDLGLVTEIVAFYAGLETLQSWSQALSEPTLEMAKTYAGSFAGVLGASLYLQARLSAATSAQSRHLGTPTLSPTAAQTFAAVTDLRRRLGQTVQENLRFHPNDAERNP